MSEATERLEQARLYLVCDSMPDGFLHAVLEAGVDIVQLRMKDAGEEEILGAAKRFASACREHGALFILNDRPDLVLCAEADGVHLGQEDLAAGQAREILGPNRLIGLSTHTPEQIKAAAGVDYIGVGPVHATPTKPGRPAVGLELVRYAADHATTPFFAIGGIDETNIAAAHRAGAHRIAVVRALTESGEPATTARSLRAALETEGATVGTT